MIQSKRQTIAVIGYGSQGRALAMNWRDSGYDVTVGLRDGSPSRALTKRDNIARVTTISKAVENSDIVVFAFPDHEHGRVYDEGIKPYLEDRATLLFLHGMSVHFGFFELPEHSDIVLLAPHGPGNAVRDNFVDRGSMSAFAGVYRDATGTARDTLQRLAAAAGFEGACLIDTTFEDEAIGDMFGEQAVLCGGLASLIKNGFEVLVEDGIDPDNAYLEVAYQLDLIVDLIKQHGIEGMLRRISVAARAGSVETGPDVIDESVKRRMKQALERIKSGRFPEKLTSLTPEELAKLDRDVSDLSHPDLERAARRFSDISEPGNES